MYTHEQKVSHLKALYYIANSDNVYSEIEATYIMNVAKHLGVNLDEEEHFQEDGIDLVLPKKEHQLYSLFHRLALIVILDDNIREVEKQYCRDLGIRMGLHPNAVNEVIEHVITEGIHDPAPERVLGIFRKYLN